MNRLIALLPWFSIACLACGRVDDKICATSAAHYRAGEEAQVKKGLRGPLPDGEVEAHRKLCLDVVDRQKPGPKDCIARCYATGKDREALFDCDTRCAVAIQTAR